MVASRPPQAVRRGAESKPRPGIVRLKRSLNSACDIHNYLGRCRPRRLFYPDIGDVIAFLALPKMFWLNWPNGTQGKSGQGSNNQGFNALSLDIVGIVAILGEGSILRNAQASALSWHHVVPRLIPAPQALIKHDPEKRLPSALGTVVGAYSGNVRFELNFFCRLIHAAEEPMEKNEVRMVELHKKKDKLHEEAYGVKPYGMLHALSLLGFAISISLVGLSIHLQDGFGLMATLLLSLTSSTVGFASRWTLRCEEEKPHYDTNTLPHSDVVIYYKDLGAFRIVRCDEEAIARLYFKAEECVPVLSDHVYRAFALFATSTLIFGLISLSNSHNILQLAFAASYVLLNTLYWASSCLNPLKHHWTHNYTTTPVNIEGSRAAKITEPSQQELNRGDEMTEVEQMKSPEPVSRSLPSKMEAGEAHLMKANRPVLVTRRGSSMLKVPKIPKLGRGLSRQPTKLDKQTKRFSDALWTAIALTGSTRWLRLTHIVPDTTAWEKWVEEAGIVAESGWDPVHHRVIVRRLTDDGKLVSAIEEPAQTFRVYANKVVTIPVFLAGLLGKKRKVVDEEQKTVRLVPWDYQGRLSALLNKYKKKRPSWPNVKTLQEAGVKVQTDPKQVEPYAKRWRERAKKHGMPLPGDEAIQEEDERTETGDGQGRSAQAVLEDDDGTIWDESEKGKQPVVKFAGDTK